MKKLSFLLVLFAISSSSFAGWHYDDLVGFNAHTDGGLTMVVETNHECGSTVLVVPTPESEHTDRIISVLLAHQAQNKKVRFAIQSCDGTVAVIDRVRTY